MYLNTNYLIDIEGNRTSNAILVGGVVREDGPDKRTKQLAIILLVPGP